MTDKLAELKALQGAIAGAIKVQDALKSGTVDDETRIFLEEFGDLSSAYNAVFDEIMKRRKEEMGKHLGNFRVIV